MSESQSRYSIVERLTEKKIQLMSEKSQLKNQVSSTEQRVNALKSDLANWKKDVQEDIKRAEREKELNILKAQEDLVNVKSRQSEQEKGYVEQIKAVDEAMRSIEEISKTAPTN